MEPKHMLIHDALRAVRRYLEMPTAYLSTFDGRDLVFQAVSDDGIEPPFHEGQRIPADGSYCKLVRDGKLPQLLPDTRDNPLASSLQITHETPIGAIISVPLTSRTGEPVGMFCCISPLPMPQLSAKDHTMVCMFAALAEDVLNSHIPAPETVQALRDNIDEVIAKKDFDIHLQPILDLRSHQLVGMEALTRFRGSPDKSPQTWFADAAAVERQSELEIATIRAALSHFHTLPPTAYLALNASADTISTGRLRAVLDIPDATRLVLEITEHQKASDAQALRVALGRIRELGVRVAVDDLGAGYAGLSAVLMLRPDIIKLDRALIENIHLDAASQALARAMVHFSSDLGAALVAEGLENEEERAMVEQLGVSLGQGFLLGKPNPARDSGPPF